MNLTGTEWVAVIGIISLLTYGIVYEICRTMRYSYDDEEESDEEA